MTFITIFQHSRKRLTRPATEAVTHTVNCLEDVQGNDAQNWQYECEFPWKATLHAHTCIEENVRNGQKATLFNVNWRVQVAKLILVPQDPTFSQVFCCSCLGSFHKHKVFLEELILLDSTLITHIACRQKMALQAIRWETIILF